MGSVSMQVPSGGAASLPSGVDGDLMIHRDGSWQGATDADVQANSGSFGAGLTAQTATLEGNMQSTNPVTGNACEVDPDDGLTFNATQVTPDMIAGIASGSPSASDPVARVSQASSVPDAIEPQGILFTPPSSWQPGSSLARQLNAATKGLAQRFILPGSLDLDSIAFYLHAVGTAGNINIKLCDDGTAPDGCGFLNASQSPMTITMTSDTAPSPYVARILDKDGANAEISGSEAYKLFNGTHANATDGGISNAVPSAPAPIYFGFSFGSAIAINRIRVWALNSSDINVRGMPQGFVMHMSNVATPTWNTDTDWTQITGDVSTFTVLDPGALFGTAPQDFFFNNSTGYLHIRLKITGRSGAAQYTALGLIEFFTAQVSGAPGTVLLDCGATASGSSASVTLSTSFTATQLIPGHAYWLTFLGSAGADFSLSEHNLGSGQAAEFPDGSLTKSTLDGGTTWNTSRQNGRLTCLNVILNPTAHRCVPLYYGQETGSNIALSSGAAWATETIPAAGIKVDCEAFSAATQGYAYVYKSGGVLVGNYQLHCPCLATVS